MEADIRWQQRFANDCRALEQLEGFFDPPELNEREELEHAARPASQRGGG